MHPCMRLNTDLYSAQLKCCLVLFGVKFSDEFLVNLALKGDTNTTQDGNKVVESHPFSVSFVKK